MIGVLNAATIIIAPSVAKGQSQAWEWDLASRFVKRKFPAAQSRYGCTVLALAAGGELLVSAAEGWELADLGGRHHAGGGSHGSLVAGVKFLVEHFGVAVPEAMEAPAGVR